MCHGSLIMLMITNLCSLYFPPYFRHVDFTFIITAVGELIFPGQTIEVTVYANAQLIALVTLEIKIHLSIKYGILN